ncbi:MAG: DedA family protein [Acidimicrobiales bacterium]
MPPSCLAEGGYRSRRVLAAAETGAALGLPAIAGLLVAMEAGVPIPIPSDIILLVLGERTQAGNFPLLLVVVALELVAAVGTACLFFLIRGPGRAFVTRVGPRVGLTHDRLRRASALIERKGRPALLIGRATPGLRTVTVAAAATSTVPAARALPALILGSSVFVQLHLVLGYLFGPVAREAVHQATGPAIAVLVALALVGVFVWIRRRGRRDGAQAATEACCPVCLALGKLAPGTFGLEALEPATG